MNWKVFRIGLVLALAAAVVAIVFASGESAFGVFIISRVLLVFGLPVLALFLLALILIRRWRADKGLESPITVVLATAIGIAILTPASYLGTMIAEWRFEKAKASIGATVAALEQFKSVHGRFPNTLDEAASEGIRVPVPAFAHRGFYVPENQGQTFRIILSCPEPFTEWVFFSRTQEWVPCKAGYGTLGD